MQLINQIRNAFNSIEGVEPSTTAKLAKQYHTEVQILNERLMSCVDLLRKGLRSEAIQQATLNPDALTLASDLEFPEVEEWIDVLRFLDIVPPARVNRDAVLQINEAIVETQPIESLLKNHRRLAIAKAPLGMRLKVLRRISQLDPVNPVWIEDVEKWEREREKQIPNEFQRAKKDQDRFAVDRLFDELHQEKWVIKVDERLAAEIKEAKEDFEYQDAIEKLTLLADQLHTAFSELDDNAAKSLCQSWNEIRSAIKKTIPAHLTDIAEPVFTWLSTREQEQAQETERADAVDRLETLMNSNTTLENLERAYAKATRFEKTLPIQTEQRYRGITEQLKLRSKRKIQLLITTVVAASLLIAIVIALQVNRAITNQQIAEASSQLSAMITDGRINDASSYLTTLENSKPKIFNSESVQAHLATVTQLITEEEERRATFEGYIAQADNADPVLINLSILSRAENLAKSPSEQSQVDAIRFRWQAWNSMEIEKQTNEAMDIVVSIEEKLNVIDDLPATNETINNLDVIVTQLDNIPSKFPKRGKIVDAKIQVLRNKAVSRSRSIALSIERMNSAKQAETAILTASSLTGLATALDRYGDNVMNASMARELKTAALDQELWNKTGAIGEFLDQGKKLELNQFTTLELEELSAVFAGLSDGLVTGDSLQGFELLDELVSLHNSRDEFLTELEDRLSLSPAAELLTVIPSESKERFFTFYITWLNAKDRIEAADPSEKHGIDKLVDINGAVELRQVQLPVKFVQEPRTTIKWISKELRDNRFDILINWRDPLLKLISDIHKRSDLDGLIKEELTREILQTCCDGLGDDKSRLSDALERLEDRQETSERWYAEKTVDNNLPADCKDWLVAALSDAFGQPNEGLVKVSKLFRQEWDWIGTLWRNDAGDIVLRTRDGKVKEGLAFIIQKTLDGTNKPELIKIGSWQNDQLKFDEVESGLLAGRPVFLLSTP